MNVILQARARRYRYLDTYLRSILIKEIWIDYLKRNEGDHLHTLYEIEYARALFETQEEYEVCQALQDIVDNYEQLSQLKLR